MIITYSQENTTRLDKYLVASYPEISRAQLQKLVKTGKVLVNKKKVLPHHFLKNNDEIEIADDFLSVVKPAAELKELVPNKNIKLEIVQETADYLVVNKPAGLLIHPTLKNETDTLANALLAYYPPIKNVGDNLPDEPNVRPGIVHRLDREVSGLVVIAKNQKMFEYLKQQFKNREIKKEYAALVFGVMSQSSGEINFAIGQSLQGGKMAARPEQNESDTKEALTFYEVVKQFQHYALLKVEIKTGRTHQIRVHLNALNHPVVGDQVYKPKNLKSRVDLGRIFLHAQGLGFLDLSNSWQEFHSELPEDLADFLKTLA